MSISAELPAHRRIIQDFLLVWLDSTFEEVNNENCRASITELRCIVKNIHMFANVDQCIDFLTDIRNEKVFMIVSDNIDQHIVHLIHDVPQLDSIYILCENESTHQHWIRDWWKIKGAFTQIASICKELSQDAQRCDQNSISISFIPATNDISNPNLDELDQSFMYTQILKGILLKIKHDEQSIKDFVAYCREQYIDNYIGSNSIDEFEKEYHLHSPIWWYTSSTFIYSMVNRALRTQEINTIIKMGFFIGDLHRHVDQLHSEQFLSHVTQPFTVYRGQGLSKADFDKMMQSKGGLMSFNNFLSTSNDRDISFAFADSNTYHSDLIGILFELAIDPTISSTPFGRLDNVSYYKELEQEILFSMHTVFRIATIQQIDDNNNRLWLVKLTLTNDNDQQLEALTKCIRERIEGHTEWHRLTQLLIEIGEYDKAEEVSRVFMNQISRKTEKPYLYNQLGAIKKGQGKYVEALSFFETGLQITQQIRPLSDGNCGGFFQNIGELHCYMGEYSKALDFGKKGLRILEEVLPSNHPTLATVYGNIASACRGMGDYSKALPYQKKALEIRENSLPQNHPDLAVSYNVIGALYVDLGKYAEALSSYKKALQIRQKSLPQYHPAILNTYNRIAKTCSMLRNYSEAISYQETALKICDKIYLLNHPECCAIYVTIGSIYDDMGQSSTALSYYEKVLKIYEKTPPENQIDLATFYNNIGLVYTKIRDYPKAMSFHNKALEIRQRVLPPNHCDFGQSYNNIGFMYVAMGEYSKAFSSYQKALEIKRKIFPPNHPPILGTYNNMVALCSKIEK